MYVSELATFTTADDTHLCHAWFIILIFLNMLYAIVDFPFRCRIRLHYNDLIRWLLAIILNFDPHCRRNHDSIVLVVSCDLSGLLFLLVCLGLSLDSLNLHHDLVCQLINRFSYTLVNYGLSRWLIIPIIIYFTIFSSLNACYLFSLFVDLHLSLSCLLLFLSIMHFSQPVKHARDKFYLVFNRFNLDPLSTWQVKISFILYDLQVTHFQIFLELIQLVVIFLK